jgi:hypothetical protein
MVKQNNTKYKEISNKDIYSEHRVTMQSIIKRKRLVPDNGLEESDMAMRNILRNG